MTLYLPDLGVVSALGAGKAELLRRVLACDDSGMEPYGPLLMGASTWVGPVRSPLPELPAALAAYDCRNNRMLAAALDEIAGTVAALRERFGPKRIAVLIGTSTSGIANGEDAAESLAASGRMPERYHYRQQELGGTAEFAARYLGVDGLRYTISTACSSSAKVFASAQRLLETGRCDAAVVGGADSLCRLTLNGFDSLDSLARERCNPFSLNRRGINIGEGACVLVVTREPAAIRLCGVGESSDGYHISAPDPTGRGAEIALRAALERANAAPRDVGYVNLHGTATPKNDEMEAAVVARVLGRATPCASTKPLTGHTLGAAGAHELGICWVLLSEANAERRLPAHVWDGVADPALEPIALVAPGERWERDLFLSNSFAFGGSNTTVAIGRA